MDRRKRLLNFVSFEVGWFSCALGVAGGLPFVGPIVVGVLFCIQRLLVPAPGKYARFVLVATLIGWLIDSVLYRVGTFSFPEGGFGHWLCPIWIAALWANFAGTLHFCLDWLRGRYLLASTLGAVGGPLAYYGGYRLDAMKFGGNTTFSLAVIAIEWALAAPGLVYLSERHSLDGLRTTTRKTQPAGP